MASEFPDPFITNPINAELVEQNKIGLLLVGLDDSITPITIDTPENGGVGYDYFNIIVGIETTKKYGITHPAWRFVVKVTEFDQFVDRLDGSKLEI